MRQILLSSFILTGLTATPAFAQDSATSVISASIEGADSSATITGTDANLGVIKIPRISGNACNYQFRPSKSFVLGVEEPGIFDSGKGNPEPGRCEIDESAQTPTFEIDCKPGSLVTYLMRSDFNGVFANNTTFVGSGISSTDSNAYLEHNVSHAAECPQDGTLPLSTALSVLVFPNSKPTDGDSALGTMTVELIF